MKSIRQFIEGGNVLDGPEPGIVPKVLLQEPDFGDSGQRIS